MRILLGSLKGDGSWFVWLLLHEGHSVDWFVTSERDADSLQGIIHPPLKRAPNPNNYDLIVFDATGLGEAADYARTVTPTIGGSALADRLEKDRIFGIEVMEQAGIRVPAWEAFDSESKAIAWLKKTHKRCVFKPIGDAPSASTYVAKSEEDMVNYLPRLVHKGKAKEFILQEFVPGTEVSTEAWWTGAEWVALNHTLEEKKLMAGGIGPNTGCAGNVVWMPTRPNAIFEQGLSKIAPLLTEHGHVGMMDLNTIVTEGDIYGLEWTPRFGYEGTCNLTQLLPVGFGEFLYEVALGKTPTNLTPKHKFAATIRLSVPPYPNAEGSRKKEHIPILGVDPKKLEKFVLYDAIMEDGELVTSGSYMAIGCPIGCAETVKGAFNEVEECIGKLNIPDLQWRNDCAACCQKRYETLERQGWLRPIG